MNQKTNNLKNLILAAAVSLGFAASAFAQDPLKSPPNPNARTGEGLLGGTYTGIAWNYYKLNDGPPSVARGLSAYFNQALADNIDLGVNYDRLRARSAGFSTTEQKLGLSMTSFLKADWGKPFLTAGLDHAWRNSGLGKHGSWGLGAETGVEFQANALWAVTPFVGWDRETSFNRNDLRYGVRSTVRLTRAWSVTGTAQWLDVKREVDRAGYSVGVNYHF
jgi:opacity protein-like surface antigen